MNGVVSTVARRGLGLRPLFYAKKATYYSGPPKVKISFGEKMISGAVLSTAITVPSFYIMSQILNYRAMSGQL